MTQTVAAKNNTNANLCPCGSGIAPAECCVPYIRGKKQPETAEALLRSRYTAFTLGEVDYILATHHSKTLHEVKREEIEEWSKKSTWHGLQLVQMEGGQAKDERGTIVFCARYTTEGQDKVEEHWEQSFFEKEGGRWKFLDARGVHQGTYRRENPKIGRNDPCPCGSSKKFKKCCGTTAA